MLRMVKGPERLDAPTTMGMTRAGRPAGSLQRDDGRGARFRWVALAAGLSVMVLVVALAGQALGSDAVVTWAAGILVAILPLATGAAILRYRLFDLDRIISRTVAYGLLAVLLGGGYPVLVLGLGQLLRRRYDAARTVEAFSARLRHELDLTTLTGELLAVVHQTIQPTQASLWLRPPRRSSEPVIGRTAV
jgi:hypothetical protein